MPLLLPRSVECWNDILLSWVNAKSDMRQAFHWYGICNAYEMDNPLK